MNYLLEEHFSRDYYSAWFMHSSLVILLVERDLYCINFYPVYQRNNNSVVWVEVWQPAGRVPVSPARGGVTLGGVWLVYTVSLYYTLYTAHPSTACALGGMGQFSRGPRHGRMCVVLQCSVTYSSECYSVTHYSVTVLHSVTRWRTFSVTLSRTVSIRII